MSVALLVADGLTDQGFDVRDPALENSHFLKITNARHAYCEIIIGEEGAVSWEYRAFSDSIDPARVACMVLGILQSDCPDSVELRQRQGLTLKGTVGRALRELGLQVRMIVLDRDDFGELYSEIDIVNPAMPDRGRVRIDDEGIVRWDCRLSDPAQGIQGIGPADLADTIAQVLQRAEQAGVTAHRHKRCGIA
jgi:hypothetical protein